MRPETDCTPEARYLQADAYCSDDALNALQAKCVHHRNLENGDAYERFMNWKRQANEILVLTWNAYADLIVPKKFDCIFCLANPQDYTLVNYELTQSILLLGDLYPINSIEQGHKHLGVLTFEQEVPAIFGWLHQEDGSYCKPIENREKLGFCMAHDLPAITERLEKVAKLRSQYGSEWWKYDEYSN
ncbi:hypothetical protein Q5H93_10765 [Hymenobacter sp. ASUV-10]|uniref:Uncharacterized protein n=1 Tax=Hymenobacter aranciens TaxID=3063996 RepID=A0ABT9BBY9_9BACT|nr:hypothetical protein [Hymenobacter sp. ASUV-10]MDO7875214.1 hypothetical protein [Hymenobacter sp. ASUV-10]